MAEVLITLMHLNEIGLCQGIHYWLNSFILVNQFKNPIKVALSTNFVYFSCISHRFQVESLHLA